PAFLNLPPGTRIVDNTFEIPGWTPDAEEHVESSRCSAWCTALLWIVPAKVAGTWKLGGDELRLEQNFQIVKGVLTSGPSQGLVENGRLSGAQIMFRLNGADYTGRVEGNRMDGVMKLNGIQRPWTATR